MRNGNYWVVVFGTGGFGNAYAGMKDAIEYANACNRYSERHSGERVVREIWQFRNHEKVKVVSA